MKNKRWYIAAPVIAAALLAVLALVSGLKSGEADQEHSVEEVPTIRILTIGEIDQEALTRVSAALSEITRERVGCRVELRMIRKDEYDEWIDDLLLASDVADILVCRDRTTLNKLMAGSYIYRLDRYLEHRPRLREAVPDESAWEQAESQGHTYGIPFGNSGSCAWGFLMRGDICDALNVDPGAVTTLEQLHDVLLRVRERYPDMIPVVNDYGEMESFASEELIVGQGGCLIVDGGIVDISEWPEFLERCALMEQWYEEDLILRGAQLNQAGRDRWIGDDMAFGSFARLDRYTARELEYTLDAQVACAVLDERYYGDSDSEMSFVVYHYTEDVDLCLQVLELIYTDEAVLHLCVYGEENVDHVRAANGAVMPNGDGGYYNWCWPMRDRAAPPVSAEEPNWYAEDAEGTFHFDNSAVSNEIYQCGEVLEKYYEALCSGAIDAEHAAARMHDELESANQTAVRAELKRQWDAWQGVN